MPTLAVTAGEPAGIGPDLIVATAAAGSMTDCLVFADPDLLRERAQALNLTIAIRIHHTPRLAPPSTAPQINVYPLALYATCRPGQLDRRNAAYVLKTLEAAAAACLSGDCAALVTAPVHKGIINDAGHDFSGHTEFLAAQCDGQQRAVMMLACAQLRVALVTTHLPLALVPAHITQAAVWHTLEVVHDSLIQRFGCPRPRITVCGLNPHAGEGGHLGREEIDAIAPAIATARSRGYDVTGPLPADTAFTPRSLQNTDVIVAMYHDQGLPVLKHLGFASAVNITLGLPLVRTSVDHGTALDRAATQCVDRGSFSAALKLARSLAGDRCTAPERLR